MSTTKRVIRVLIGDDHPAPRVGSREVLERARDIEVVGEARDGTEAMRMVAKLHPHVLLLDLVMPGPRACEVEGWVRANHAKTTVLVLTAHDRDCFLAKMVEAGVQGFLSKEEACSRIVDAVRRVARGESVITRGQLERARSYRAEVSQVWDSLAAQERRVLELLTDGSCTKEIAKALVIEETTVCTHIGNIVDKLGVGSRAEAIAWAWRHKVFERMGFGV